MKTNHATMGSGRRDSASFLALALAASSFAFIAGCDGLIGEPISPPDLYPRTCLDGIQNFDETAVDCGGECVGCPAGTECTSNDACSSGACVAGTCTEALCTDGVQNGNETGVDCGGFCVPCVPALDPDTAPAPATPVRRFTRAEYTRVMQTLLGGAVDFGATFPNDGETNGFDNIASSLTTDDAHARAHLANVDAGVASALAERPESILVCTEPSRSCALQVLVTFAEQAWRRPLGADAEELGALYDALTAEGIGHGDAVRTGLRAILMAPDFFFRLEVGGELVPRALDAHELALRLSMFVWSDLPDAELRGAADSGALLEGEELRRQLRRMVTDPRAEGWIQNFAGQIYNIRRIETHPVDSTVFPEFTDEVRRSAILESEAYVQRMLREDLPLGELVNSRWTRLDATLADYYGVPAPAEDFEVSELPAERGLGLLARIGFLTTTSEATSTSVVRRGDTILANIMCIELVLPEGVITELEEEPEGTEERTLRERLEAHRANPSCASCHDHIDPVGFAFEHFDAVGRYRDVYSNGEDVNDSGSMVGLGDFEDGVEIAPFLATDARFRRCQTRNLLTYALGRRVEGDDEVWVADIAQRAFAGGEASFADLMEEIVASRPFRMTGGVR